MDSSSGFGSTPGDYRAVHTRFRCGSGCDCLNRPPRVTRRIILQKARRQPGLRPRPSTARKQTVSGSISLPSPGCFSPFPHGTLRYRSLRVGSLGKWAPQLHTGLLVSGATQERLLPRSSLLLPGCHGLRRRFPDVFGWLSVSSLARQRQLSRLTTPTLQGLPAWHSVGLGCSRFARHYYGNTFCSSGYMRCFSSPGALRTFARSSPEGDGVAPFGDRGITACSRLPHAYRSYATSFIGTQRRGIHPLLLVSSLQEGLKSLLA